MAPTGTDFEEEDPLSTVSPVEVLRQTVVAQVVLVLRVGRGKEGRWSVERTRRGDHREFQGPRLSAFLPISSLDRKNKIFLPLLLLLEVHPQLENR